MAALFLSLHLLRLFLSQLRRSASLGYVDTAPPEHLLHLWRVDYARLGREAKHAHQPIACPLRLRYPVKAIAPTKDLQGARSEGSCGNWGRTRAALRGIHNNPLALRDLCVGILLPQPHEDKKW